ncbi:hypothetical protein PLESTM_001666900 [Pleodorina starrii]|nr:hypothetical protein PLESTM_001666900 [Pleodorina starrii]
MEKSKRAAAKRAAAPENPDNELEEDNEEGNEEYSEDDDDEQEEDDEEGNDNGDGQRRVDPSEFGMCSGDFDMLVAALEGLLGDRIGDRVSKRISREVRGQLKSIMGGFGPELIQQVVQAFPALKGASAVQPQVGRAAGARSALHQAAARRAAPPRVGPLVEEAQPAAGQLLDGMVHSMLCAVVSGPYTTAQEGHMKLYKTFSLLVEALAESEPNSQGARYCVKALKAIT